MENIQGQPNNEIVPRYIVLRSEITAFVVILQLSLPLIPGKSALEFNLDSAARVIFQAIPYLIFKIIGNRFNEVLFRTRSQRFIHISGPFLVI